MCSLWTINGNDYIILFSVKKKVEQLDELMENLVSKELEPLHKNMTTYANSYNKFCTEHDFTPFPASCKQIHRYMAYLTSTHESAEGIANYVSSIKSLHALTEYQIPDSRGLKVQNII